MSASGALNVHTAAQNNQIGLLKSLLEKDPTQLNAVDNDGRTPFQWAASFPKSIDVLRILLEYKPDIELDRTDVSGWTALHMAASAGNEEGVRALVEAGADVNKGNDKGITPLHYAASKSRVEIGEFLIQHGADINAKDRANQHPLHRAATTGSTGFVTLLLNPPEGRPKTRLNTGDRIGNTPLHLAIESGHGQAAVLLIEAGADRSRMNGDGQAPEELEGVGGREQKQVRDYIVERCGKP